MSAERFDARVLVAGHAEGYALCLDEPLSFWGGYDPQSGEIIDVHHPQYGQRVGGRILFMPESRGSAGTPGGIAETLRNGSGPAALVLGKADINVSIGALVANRLYDLSVPVLVLPVGQLRRIGDGQRVSIDADGAITLFG
jgi:predicted aconitase with swiveling domain